MADGPPAKPEPLWPVLRPALWGVTKLAVYAGAAWLAYVIYEAATVKSLLSAAVVLLVFLAFRSRR